MNYSFIFYLIWSWDENGGRAESTLRRFAQLIQANNVKGLGGIFAAFAAGPFLA